ncbi:MAG: DUF1015 domain-containing protein [Clostridiales bacterium]|nr:DUF1015 domain-containing protein [Clostridiales bacterium]
MITVKPFSALRPTNEYVKECAALPYDVMSSDEARVEVQGKPYSFLHIDKAEIDLDKSIDLYDERVYAKAAENLKKFEADGVYKTDERKKYYFYRQIMDGRAQTGIVGCASIDDYINGKIKKHELTRADKELDRIRHVDTCSAQTGPIFLAYKASEKLDEIIATQTAKAPLYDFVADDNIQHTVWDSDSVAVDEEIEKAFSALEALYIADGHHRAASAVKAGLKRREAKGNYDGSEEFNFFLSVIFPANSLKIFDYNRLLKDLGGRTQTEFLEAVEKALGKVSLYTGDGAYRPQKTHEIGLYVGGNWYCVEFKKEICNAEKPSERLDCAILQKELLSAVLGIHDPRTDKRIDFVGGIRGLNYLEKRCHEDMAVAIAMYPTTLEELIAVADAGEIMPPKSTWFEPKLRSGIFIHKI